MSRIGRVLRQLGLLVALSVVAGLLVAAMVLPVVGGAGYAAKATDDSLSSLPTALDAPPLAQHSILRAADGSILATLTGPEDRVVEPLTAVPAVMQKSIVAIEDNRFYEHNGVDIRGLLRALKFNTTAGGYAEGASTITQQYVKNVLLQQAGSNQAQQEAATGKSISRKLREARYSIALEKRLTKAQILERYLNIAYFGEGIYGVGSAAEHYFGVPVQSLTLAQSALLAGLVNNPTAYDPVNNPKDALSRRNLVLEAVGKYGFLPEQAVAAAEATKIALHVVPHSLNACVTSTAPLFCQYALNTLLNDRKLGATRNERANAVYEGGLDITTSYDAATQKALDAGIAANVPNKIHQVVMAAAVQPGTGAVLAISQNRTYGTDKSKGQSETPYATQTVYDTGSTFKAVTLATALSQGLPLTTGIYSPGCLDGLPDNYRPCNAGGGGESGYYDMVTGTWFSVNTYYVQLEERIGYRNVVAMAKKLGDTSPGLDRRGLGLSLTLGSANGTSAVNLATIYATLAAHGRECDPSVITDITTLTGELVNFTPAKSCRQAIPAALADTETAILQGVLSQQGATASGKGLGKRPSAGKTGTLDVNNGAWFVGYTPGLAVAVGLTDPLRPSMADAVLPITSLKTGRTYSSRIFGGDIPADTWQSIMSVATKGTPVQNFALPQIFNAYQGQRQLADASAGTSGTYGTPGTPTYGTGVTGGSSVPGDTAGSGTSTTAPATNAPAAPYAPPAQTPSYPPGPELPPPFGHATGPPVR